MTTLDFNNLIIANIYSIDSGTIILNGPAFTPPGTLIVKPISSPTSKNVQQTLFTRDNKGFIRTFINNVWSTWDLINESGGGGVTPDQIQKQAFTFALDTGTADNYVINLNPLISTLQTGMQFAILIANTNLTSNVFLTANGINAIPIISTKNEALSPGSLIANGISYVTYDGGVFQLLNPQSNLPLNEIVWFSKSGDNNSADGTFLKPFETPTAANNFITDNSAIKPYIIRGTPGNYMDTDYLPKPYVTLDLNGSSYTVTNTVTLHSSWTDAVSGYLGIFNSENFNLVGGVNLDFNAFNVTNSILKLNNLTTEINSTYIVNAASAPGQSTITIINGVLGYGNQPNIVINNSFGSISNGAAANITYSHTSENSGGHFNITGMIELGDLLIEDSTATGMNLFLTDNKSINDAIFKATGDGTLKVYDRGSLPINSYTLDGENVDYDVDTINNYPTLLNGATYTPTTIANGVKANITATNYTPTDESVAGHLEGVNNELGNLQSQVDTLNSGYVNFEAIAMAAVDVDISNPGTDTFDTYVATIGDTIFLGINQTAAQDRGLYTFNGTSAPMTRIAIYNTWEAVVNSRIYINNFTGSAYGGTIWINTNQAGGTLGSTAIIYIQSYNVYQGSPNIDITGNIVDLAQMPANTFKANLTGSPAIPTNVTDAQVKAALGLVTNTFTISDGSGGGVTFSGVAGAYTTGLDGKTTFRLQLTFSSTGNTNNALINTTGLPLPSVNYPVLCIRNIGSNGSAGVTPLAEITTAGTIRFINNRANNNAQSQNADLSQYTLTLTGTFT